MAAVCDAGHDAGALAVAAAHSSATDDRWAHRCATQGQEVAALEARLADLCSEKYWFMVEQDKELGRRVLDLVRACHPSALPHGSSKVHVSASAKKIVSFSQRLLGRQHTGLLVYRILLGSNASAHAPSSSTSEPTATREHPHRDVQHGAHADDASVSFALRFACSHFRYHSPTGRNTSVAEERSHATPSALPRRALSLSALLGL